MRKIMAVAVLDIRRLWMAVGAFGVALGILPALAQGIGAKITAEDIFPFVFGAAALVAGARFGLDFAEGKPSFFFARPLSTFALFTGRIAVLFGLAMTACLGFFTSHWLSGRQSLLESFLPITPRHLQTLAIVWIGSLFFAMAVAANTRQTAKRGLGGLVVGVLRMGGALGTTALMFGLFADVFMRAYDLDQSLVKLLFWSYVVAAFLASCVAIEIGRTDRLTITRVLNLGMYLHTVLVCAAVLAGWTYVLHPGPGTIRGAVNAFSSPDGRVAYVAARVDRGDSTFQPFFAVDLGSGDAQRLPADWAAGPGGAAERPWLWHSRDGGTRVWTEQTPMLFRYVRRLFTTSSSFRFQTSFGEERALPLPAGLDLGWRFQETLIMGDSPIDFLPSSNGDLFAVRWTHGLTAGRNARWENHLTFMSPSRGQLSDINLTTEKRTLRAWAFLATGQLRAATLHKAGQRQEMQFVDIDTKTGDLKIVASEDADHTTRVRFDGSATRALVVSGPWNERRVSLMQLEGSPQAPVQTLATGKEVDLEAAFLSDGRVALIVRQPPTAELRLFSAQGKPVFSIPLGGSLSTIGSEPFANVLSVSWMLMGKPEVLLVDITSGKILRSITGVQAAPSWAPEAPPPAGSPGARLLMSSDQKLYLLPSLTEEPRLLLPRP